MTDLARWLGVQLDEDERIARAAGGLDWSRSEHPWDTAVAIRDSKGERVVCDEGWPSEGQEVHIAEHDPARVLREIDAKRQVLADFETSLERVKEFQQRAKSGDETDMQKQQRHDENVRLLVLLKVVKQLASAHSHCPGYAEAIDSLG